MRIDNVQPSPVGSEYFASLRQKQVEEDRIATNAGTVENIRQPPEPPEKERKIEQLDVLPDSENMLEFVKSFNRFLRTIDNGYTVHYDQSAARDYLVVRDLVTNKVLSQYPAEDMLELISRVRSMLRTVLIGVHPSQVDRHI